MAKWCWSSSRACWFLSGPSSKSRKWAGVNWTCVEIVILVSNNDDKGKVGNVEEMHRLSGIDVHLKCLWAVELVRTDPDLDVLLIFKLYCLWNETLAAVGCMPRIIWVGRICLESVSQMSNAVHSKVKVRIVVDYLICVKVSIFQIFYTVPKLTQSDFQEPWKGRSMNLYFCIG